MLIEQHNLTVTAPNSKKGTHSSLTSVPFLAIKEKILGKHYDLSVSFVGPTEARELNQRYRGKDYVPNTLAFELDKHKSGEIVMCRSAMRGEHHSFGMTPHEYLVFLFIHSCLHLKGYAHGGTMERKEKQLLAFFGTRSHGKTHHNRRD